MADQHTRHQAEIYVQEAQRADLVRLSFVWWLTHAHHHQGVFLCALLVEMQSNDASPNVRMLASLVLKNALRTAKVQGWIKLPEETRILVKTAVCCLILSALHDRF
jgi:hypothetical protein